MPYLTSSFLHRDRIDLLAGSAEPESSRRILHGSATASSSSNGRSNGFSRTKLPPLDEINHCFATRCPTPTYGPRAAFAAHSGGRANQRLVFVGPMYGIYFEDLFFALRRRCYADEDAAAFACVEEIVAARLSRKSCSIASAATGLEYK